MRSDSVPVRAAAHGLARRALPSARPAAPAAWLATPAGARRVAALAAAVCALGAVPWAVHAQGPAGAQPAKLGVCITCHGEQGLSQLPDAPNLAGQPEIYLREQLRAYRSGKRVNETMNVIAKGLTDADIAELAGWYAGHEIQVKPRAGR